MSLAVQVTIDATEPAALAEFWALALGYRPVGPPGPQWARLADPDGTGPRLFFQRVPEAKRGKNRVHLDVHASAAASDRDDAVRMIRAHAEVLVAAGARLVEERDEPDQFWIVMQDPEGNEFCVD
jgi:hypothetical protein